MHSPNTTTSLQALYKVFVLPTLHNQQLSHTVPRRLPCLTVQQSRHFRRPTASRPPEARRQKWDSEITAKVIHLVDPATGRLSDDGPRTTYDILRTLDTSTYRLVQLTDGGTRDQPYPVCRVENKKDAYEAEKKRKAQAKDAKKAGAKSGESGMKTLEINWAIDANDLGHRLERMREFLEEGRRVEVVLAAKKQGRKANREECEGVLKKIQEAVVGVPGAKERSPLEGKMGGLATMVFQGKAAGTSNAHIRSAGGGDAP